MKERCAVYAGSFDPPTNGHLYVIERGARLFDNLVVAVGVNPDKHCMFSTEARVAMLNEIVRDYPNVTTASFVGVYLVHYVKSIGASHVLRGIRGTVDDEYEKGVEHINKLIDPAIKTQYLRPPADVAAISSSVVRGLIGFARWREIVPRLVPPSVFSKILEWYGRSLWRDFWGRIASNADADVVYSGIVTRYREPHRSYHVLEHILHCHEELREVRHLLEDPDAVEAALWLHDVVYNPTRQDNEDESARFATSLLKISAFPESRVQAVASLILTTRGHVAATTDAAVLVDIDLAILGQLPSLFEEYEGKIRKEYGWVPEATFREKRASILQQFLDRPSIYATPHFREKYEKAAHENLACSIARLRDIA